MAIGLDSVRFLNSQEYAINHFLNFARRKLSDKFIKEHIGSANLIKHLVMKKMLKIFQ